MVHLDPDENIVLEVRKHWFVFFSHGFFLAMAAVAPFVAYNIVKNYISINISMSGNPTGILLFFYSIWLLGLWMSFFVQWTNYYLDVWYVTEKRIIDVEQKRLFHRSVSSLRFDKIQDISIEVKGLIDTFFDIGNIKVQTAAENSADFVMLHAGSPDRVRNLIFKQHNIESEKIASVTIVNKKDGANRE